LNDEQQDWFGQFTPARGVHLAPPPASPGPRQEIVFRRSARARSYRLSLGRDGVAVATIPVRGSMREAQRFVELNREWLDRARERQRRRPRTADVWAVGTTVLWRGEHAEIRPAAAGARPSVCLGADVFRVPKLEGDLRPVLEERFVRVAKIELPAHLPGPPSQVLDAVAAVQTASFEPEILARIDQLVAPLQPQ